MNPLLIAAFLLTSPAAITAGPRPGLPSDPARPGAAVVALDEEARQLEDALVRLYCERYVEGLKAGDSSRLVSESYLETVRWLIAYPRADLVAAHMIQLVVPEFHALSEAAQRHVCVVSVKLLGSLDAQTARVADESLARLLVPTQEAEMENVATAPEQGLRVLRDPPAPTAAEQEVRRLNRVKRRFGMSVAHWSYAQLRSTGGDNPEMWAEEIGLKAHQHAYNTYLYLFKD